jgi:hypothetical protein
MSLALTVASSVYAQDALNELKVKIWEAEVVQRNFAAGLPHCSELNGTNFYFQARDRVLNLEDYRRSFDNLLMQGAFNPETRRPCQMPLPPVVRRPDPLAHVNDASRRHPRLAFETDLSRIQRDLAEYTALSKGVMQLATTISDAMKKLQAYSIV